MDKPNFIQDFNLIETALINFTKLSCKEHDMIRTWRNSASVKRWLYGKHFITPEEHRRFVKNLKYDYRNAYWLVKNQGDEYLGVIYLNRIDFENRNSYFGIYTNPGSKLSGKGKTLLGCLIYLVFEYAGFHTLKLEVIEDNSRAIAFYKKFGFKREGRLKEFVFKEGRWKDVIVMGAINPNIGSR